MTVRMPNTPNPGANSVAALKTKRGRPMLFQITDPRNQPMWPFLMALHVNPSKLSEKMVKSKTVAMTVGGYVEWLWPDELDALSADGSTGAFINPGVGLSAGSDDGSPRSLGKGGRHASMAWERFQDLLEIFRCNGMIYNGRGLPVVRGHVMMIYDRGVYTGLFTNFDVKEDDEHAYSFQLNWEFKVESVVYTFPLISAGPRKLGGGRGAASDQVGAGTSRGFEDTRFSTGGSLER